MDAIHDRHLHIGKDQVVVAVIGKDVQGLCTGGGQYGLQPPVFQLVFEDSAVGKIVVYDQHFFAGMHRHATARRRNISRDTSPGGDRKRESRSGARLAFHPDGATHQPDQLLGNGQSETRSAVFAGRRGIYLGKSFEQPLLFIFGDTDAGIPHFEAQGQRSVCTGFDQPNPDKDLSLFGKLYRITDQIGQDLAQTQIVAPDTDRHLSFYLVQQLDVCTGGTGAENVQDMFDTIMQVEVFVFQFHTAGLDLREIEDIVDDIQEAFAAGGDGLRIRALLFIQRRFYEQGGKSDHAVHRSADLMAHGGQEDAFGTIGLFGLMTGYLGIPEGLFQGVSVAFAFQQYFCLPLEIAHLHRLHDLDRTGFFQLVGPQPADEDDNTGQQDMDDEGLQVQVIQLGKIDRGIAAVLQVVEDRMVQNDDDQQGDLQSPVLIGDEDGAGDKREEVHFEQPVHLVDVLCHEQAQHYAQHILIQIGIRQRYLDGIVGEEGETTYADGDSPGIKVMGQKETNHKEPAQEVIHEFVRPSFDLIAEEGRLGLQVGEGGSLAGDGGRARRGRGCLRMTH